MKKITQFFFVLSSFFCFSQSAESEFDKMVLSESKSAASTMNVQVNPNTQNYDITYHELRFTVNPNNSPAAISGVVKTTFTALANMSSITFDMATQLVVSSVTMNSINLTFSQSNYELNINFPSTITTGTSSSVIITYAGIPPTAEGAFTRGTHAGTPIIYTLSEPFGARDWWPCKQDLNDKINSFDMYITAPATFNSVSNGLEQSRIVTGANATTHFKHLYPIPAYLIVLNITNYVVYNQQAGLGTLASPYFPIINYLYPESNTTTIQNQLGVTPGIMNLFESLLEPYPFRNEKYGHAQFGWGGGMEHTTVSSMGSFGRDLISHELAHHWFGNKITCGTWKDIWLNEGLTEYMSGLVHEQDGPSNFVTWKNNKITSITSQPGGATYLSDAGAISVNTIFSSRLTYNKGAMITHMLRWKLGDVKFFQALKSYLADPALAYGYAITANLKAHLEAADNGNSLTEFFNDWLINQGYPTYNITAQNWGSGQAKIIVNQTQSHASVSFFEMPLEIRLTGSGSQVLDVIVNNTNNAQEFIFSVPFVVTGVIFDPNKHIISKNNTATLGNENFDMNSAISVYPVPSENELTIQFPNNVTLNKVEIYNNLGQILKTDFKNVLDISGLSRGVHFLKIDTSEGLFHKNFIKK